MTPAGTEPLNWASRTPGAAARLLTGGKYSLRLRLLIFEFAFGITYSDAMKESLRSAAALPLRLIVAIPATPTWFLLPAFANDSLKAVVAASLLQP